MTCAKRDLDRDGVNHNSISNASMCNNAYINSIRERTGFLLREAGRVASYDPTRLRATDMNDIDGVRLRRIGRRFSFLPIPDGVERSRPEYVLSQLSHFDNTGSLLLLARAFGPQLANLGLDVVEEAGDSLPISNVQRDIPNLLAGLLLSSPVAEGGNRRRGCETEAFDRAVLG